MDDEPLDADRDAGIDMRDVVAGPIGSAHLVDPSTSEAAGADLDEIPAVVPSGATFPGQDATTADPDAEPPA